MGTIRRCDHMRQIGIIGSSVQIQAESGDVTPDAVNWSGVEHNGIETVYAKQRITGIDSNIILKIDYSQVSLNIVYKISNTNDSYNTFTNPSVYGFVTIDTGDTILIEPNQYLTFACLYLGTPSNSGVVNVTVSNTSDGNVTLDTFTAEVGVID